MQAAPDTLGEFLRARREQLAPEAAGLPGGERRRVPGLRREEVAMLAGVSVEYYLRLEQGRDLHPSDQILDGLAAALQLDGDAVAYLHRLAHPAPRAAVTASVRAKTSGLTRFDHPVAGRLELSYEKLIQPESRQLLVVYHAAPGSPSAERLQLLASL